MSTSYALPYLSAAKPMSEACSGNQTLNQALSQTLKLRQYWKYYSEKGRHLHLKGMVKHATEYFLESVRIGRALLFEEKLLDEKRLEEKPVNNADHSGIELLYIASHNLASCYNHQNQASAGEQVLAEYHTMIIALCTNETNPRNLRLEALSILNKSLFSLASQLAFMGKTHAVHKMINTTAALAEELQYQLNVA